MAHYFTDEIPETRELIEKCMEGLLPHLRADYLLNCLVLKHKKNMTVKEVFEAELKSKERFEADLAGMKEKRI